jgi:hypothetical protein
VQGANLGTGVASDHNLQNAITGSHDTNTHDNKIPNANEITKNM